MVARPSWLLCVLAVSVATAFACGCASKSVPRTVPELGSFEERGRASWYGKPYHGRRTASGETYDMHELTAAHPTLPFGSLVRVTNLDNGRSTVVRINDRGPFVAGRIIDVSYAAARRLAMLRAGVVRVELVPERRR